MACSSMKGNDSDHSRERHFLALYTLCAKKQLLFHSKKCSQYEFRIHPDIVVYKEFATVYFAFLNRIINVLPFSAFAL